MSYQYTSATWVCIMYVCIINTLSIFGEIGEDPLFFPIPKPCYKVSESIIFSIHLPENRHMPILNTIDHTYTLGYPLTMPCAYVYFYSIHDNG